MISEVRCEMFEIGYVFRKRQPWFRLRLFFWDASLEDQRLARLCRRKRRGWQPSTSSARATALDALSCRLLPAFESFSILFISSFRAAIPFRACIPVTLPIGSLWAMLLGHYFAVFGVLTEKSNKMREKSYPPTPFQKYFCPSSFQWHFSPFILNNS